MISIEVLKEAIETTIETKEVLEEVAKTTIEACETMFKDEESDVTGIDPLLNIINSD